LEIFIKMSANSESKNSRSEVTKTNGTLFLGAVKELEGLNEVAELIKSKFRSDSPFIEQISSSLFTIGGKRLRPTLALLVYKAFSEAAISRPLITIAAGIELIHLATLLHDDIIDRSPLRRGQPTALATHGLEQTLLAGDYLLVRAFALCAHLELEIIHATEEACVALTEGESLELDLIHKVPTKEQYLSVAAKKTAALFSLAAFSGGFLAGLRKEETELLAQFGNNLGIAFQILDDILDVTADEESLGKKPGSDIKERKPSIVNLTWLATGSDLAQQLLTASPCDNDTFIEEALVEIKQSPTVLGDCRKLAADFASEARTNLLAVEQTTSKSVFQPLQALHSLIDYTVSRLY
jgi:octaprenyl-diphosphate synthase